MRMTASLCLILTVLLSCSMLTLATSAKPVGELLVTGSSDKAVMVNGEPAASGRTIFAATTITTPEGMTAVLDFGRAGKIELAPNTSYSLNADGSLSGNLTAGTAKVVNSSDAVSIKTLTGNVVTLNAGDMVTAESATAKRQDDDDDNKNGGPAWIPFALIFGGAVAAIAIGVALADNETSLGGNSTVVSPTR